MRSYLAQFKIQPSYHALSTEETVALLKKEWLYGQKLAIRGIRIGGYLDQRNDLVYGFYRAESEKELQKLLDYYPTELGHYAVDTVQEVIVTQDGRLGILNPIKWVLACLELLFFKIFYNSKIINDMLEKRIAPKSSEAK